MKIPLALSLVVGAGLALTACGGGNGGAAPEAAAQPAAAPPPAVAAALAYIAEQKKLPDADIDPQTLRQSLPAADDTIEPAPL